MYKHDKKMKVYIKSKAKRKHAYNNVVVVCFIFNQSKPVIQNRSSSFSSTLVGLKYFEMNNMYYHFPNSMTLRFSERFKNFTRRS